MYSGGSTPSSILQWLRLPVVDTNKCATSYAQFSANSRTPIFVTSNQICVQGKANVDACQGLTIYNYFMKFKLLIYFYFYLYCIKVIVVGH